jgi:hypothetical protein
MGHDEEKHGKIVLLAITPLDIDNLMAFFAIWDKIVRKLFHWKKLIRNRDVF